MNEAIVWCLERYFPAPATLEDKINQLADMVAALKRGNDLESQIDDVVDEIDSTLREISDGKIKASGDFREKVSRRIEEWDLDALEAANDRPFDDEQYQTNSYIPPDGGEAWEEPFSDSPPKNENKG